MTPRSYLTGVLLSLIAARAGTGDEPRKGKLELAAESFAVATGQPESAKYIYEDLKRARAALDRGSDYKWQERLVDKGKLNPKSDSFDEDLDDVAIALWVRFRGPKPTTDATNPRITFTVSFKDEPKFVALKVSNDVDNVTQYRVLVTPDTADLWIDSVLKAKPQKGKSYSGATVDSWVSLVAKLPGYKDFSESWDMKPPQKTINMEKK
jgi:hypothetical protein